MLNGVCKWVGIKDVQKEPPVQEGTEVQFRRPGDKNWVTIPTNPNHSKLDQVKVAQPPASPAEEWRPGEETKDPADEAVSSEIGGATGMPRRQTPRAVRAPKTKKPKAQTPDDSEAAA